MQATFKDDSVLTIESDAHAKSFTVTATKGLASGHLANHSSGFFSVVGRPGTYQGADSESATALAVLVEAVKADVDSLASTRTARHGMKSLDFQMRGALDSALKVAQKALRGAHCHGASACGHHHGHGGFHECFGDSAAAKHGKVLGAAGTSSDSDGIGEGSRLRAPSGGGIGL